ncbi:hypothetical protein WDW37_20150 [Bdellovibrionota bacterium FG-1]
MKWSAMLPKTWELQDPVTSPLVFIPGFETIKQALFSNHSLLWSSLRGMGMPLLGNEFQSGPLFPLTLLLSWLPSGIFWNVFALTRLILTGCATFLIGSRVFGFHKTAAALFTLCFAFALYNIRWINHAYSSGLAAGTWYIYCLTLHATSPSDPKSRKLRILAVAFTAYSLVTCGFPESSILFTLFAILFAGPLLAKRAFSNLREARFLVTDLFIAHLLAFFAASPQLFALVEFIRQTKPGFRIGIGLTQFPGFLSYFMPMITRLEDSFPKAQNIQIFGLIPLFLFFLGIWAFALSIKTLTRPYIFSIFCGLFFCLKVFPIFPAFNTWLGSLPIFTQCWFTVYFIPLLLFPFAAIAAKGLEYIRISQKRTQYLLGISLAFFTVIFLASSSAKTLFGASYFTLASRDRPMFFIAFVFLAAFLLSVLRAFLPPSRFISRYIGHILVVCAIFQFMAVRPNLFEKMSVFTPTLRPDPRMLATVDAIKSYGLNSVNYRIYDPFGIELRHLSAGLATPDLDAVAILPSRIQTFRTLFFESEWGGYMPYKRALTPFNWKRASVGLLIDSSTEPKIADNGTRLVARFGDNQSLYFDPTALSRAYLPEKCLVVGDIKETKQYSIEAKGTDLGTAYIETDSLILREFCKSYKTAKVTPIEILRDQGSVVALNTIRGPTILMLNDNFYPGWTAFDISSHSELPISPANLTFRAVFLPEPRDYQIEFRYKPYWLMPSLALCALALFGALYLLFRIIFPKRAEV